METYITVIIMQLPASEECLKAYRAAQLQDPLCSKVTEFCKTGMAKQAMGIAQAETLFGGTWMSHFTRTYSCIGTG